MNDIAKRLRAFVELDGDINDQAADEIERLRAKTERLQAALDMYKLAALKQE